MSSRDASWENCRGFFARDGSLRDVYVHEVSRQDWMNVVRFIVAQPWGASMVVNGEPVTELPSDIVMFNPETTRLLSFHIGTAVVNCHFFCDDEIELDIAPQQVADEQTFDALKGFMTALGQITGKVVTLTPENTPEYIVLQYVPGYDGVELVGDPNCMIFS